MYKKKSLITGLCANYIIKGNRYINSAIKSFSADLIAKKNNAEAHRLRKSLMLHSVAVFLLLLPLGLGLAGSSYLRGVALIGLLYFFFRSIVDMKWSVTIYLLLFFLLPDTWACVFC